MFALLLVFQNAKAFQIGSIVSVNVTEAKISTKQYPKARKLASKLDGTFAKIIGQTTNSHNHSKWIIQSCEDASAKIKIKEQHLRFDPKMERILNAMKPKGDFKFHYISTRFSFEEYLIYKEFGSNDQDKFFIFDTFRKEINSSLCIMHSDFFQIMYAHRFSFDMDLLCSADVSEFTFLKLMMLSPEWMASVFDSIKRRLGDGTNDEALEVIEVFQSLQTYHFHSMAAASIRMHMVVNSKPTLRAAQYIRLMKDAMTKIKKREGLLRRSYLRLGIGRREFFISLICEAVSKKVKIFAKIYGVGGDTWNSAVNEIVEKFRWQHARHRIHTFHVLAYCPRNDGMKGMEKTVQRLLFG